MSKKKAEEKITTCYDMGPEFEAEANSFAAAFLMPEKMIRKVYKEKNGNLSAMAKFFKVSMTAMKWRLQNLELI